MQNSAGKTYLFNGPKINQSLLNIEPSSGLQDWGLASDWLGSSLIKAVCRQVEDPAKLSDALHYFS